MVCATSSSPLNSKENDIGFKYKINVKYCNSRGKTDTSVQ